MKLFKITISMLALLAVSPVAMAVGPMEKSDIREGQLICQGNGSGLKDGQSSASGATRDDRRDNANNISAQ
jgi:hypothetical protein